VSAPSERGWEELKSAFAELADLSQAERTARLAEIGARDPGLADRLEALLAASDASEPRLARFDLLFGEAPLAEATVDPLGLIGRMIGRFHIMEVLGSGGMGVAYRARDERLGRTVALKFLLPQYSLDGDARRRLLHEARTASALDHPNICTLLEVGETPHGPYLAMPAYGGETVRQRLERMQRLPPGEAIDIVRQVLHGLEAAHAAGITHRDLKPDNLIITADGTVKILDFGLARSADLQLSLPALRGGTIGYMSPEQLRGEPAGPASDLWAVGVLLYELLTGVRPFGGGQELAALYSVLNEEPPPLSDRAPDAPPHLHAAVARLLARDPSARFETATDVLAALAGSSATPHPNRRAYGSRFRRTALVSLALLLATAAVVLPLVVRDTDADRAAGATENASVAVLPFVDTSPGRNQGHLGEGLAEEILNALIPVPGLRVPARASSFRFRDGDLPVSAIAAQLGVATVLEGSVHRDGDRLRVSARLVDSNTGRYVWSQTFDRRFRDIFAVQAEIAATVARALEVHFAPAAGSQPFSNVVAYELYLRGLFHWNRRSGQDVRQAIDFFGQATQHDSMYAAPWAGLALGYVVLALLDPAATDALQRAHRAADRALALDSTLAHAHAARGYAFHWQWRWADAQHSLERAIALDPTYATAHQWYGEHLIKMGNLRDGEAHMRNAIALDPLSLVANNDLALAYLHGRRFPEALAQLERVQRMDPGFSLALLLTHRTQLVVGDAAGAADSGRRWAELTRMAEPADVVLLSLATSDTARRRDARAILDGWERQAWPRWPEIAMYRTLIGDDDGAIRALNEGLRARSPMMAQLGSAPWFEPLRRDPRVQAMLRSMNLVHPAS
jgi:TolB-like protein/tetratricopeptide (TPR) repeat protein